jgi:hypothetical protein
MDFALSPRAAGLAEQVRALNVTCCYVVERPLPESVRQGVARPWFEQPGGGSMVALDRCLRWYNDAGCLDESMPENEP